MNPGFKGQSSIPSSKIYVMIVVCMLLLIGWICHFYFAWKSSISSRFSTMLLPNSCRVFTYILISPTSALLFLMLYTFTFSFLFNQRSSFYWTLQINVLGLLVFVCNFMNVRFYLYKFYHPNTFLFYTYFLTIKTNLLLISLFLNNGKIFL